jgi:predicted amidophosphoribosyltransferase
MLAGFTQAALDLVFPALCPLCQTTLGADRRDPLCGPCWQAITRLGRPRCHVCGAASPLASIVGDASEPVSPGRPCAACRADPPPYDYARSAAIFEGTLREALHAFKFSGKRALARPLGDLAAEHCVATLAEEIEAVVPVPWLRERRGERGFNQAELLAQRVAQRLGGGPARAGLARVRTTRPQSAISCRVRAPRERARRLPGVAGGFRTPRPGGGRRPHHRRDAGRVRAGAADGGARRRGPNSCPRPAPRRIIRAQSNVPQSPQTGARP